MLDLGEGEVLAITRAGCNSVLPSWLERKTSGDLQVALVCQRVQPRARSSILDVAADVGVIFIVDQLRWRLLLEAACKEDFDDIGDAQMHDGKYELSKAIILPEIVPVNGTRY